MSMYGYGVDTPQMRALNLSTTTQAQLREFKDPVGAQNDRMADAMGKFEGLINSDPDAAWAAISGARIPSALKAKLVGRIREARARLASMHSSNHHTQQLNHHRAQSASQKSAADHIAAIGHAGNQHAAGGHAGVSFSQAAAALQRAQSGEGNDLDGPESAFSGRQSGGR